MRIKWETAESIQQGAGLVIGTATDGRSCLYVVDTDGNVEIDDHETDGDYDGEGWPSPPARYVREARMLARGNDGFS